MPKKALTTYQIAKYCDVTPRTASLWINEKKIKAYRTVGNHNRVKREDFVNFLNEYNMPIPDDLQQKESPSKTKRILIVDDEVNMVHSIQRALKINSNFITEVAFNGFDAGQKLMEFKPDLVLLDIRMPGMDGYQVTERIRNIPALQQTKIIIISAFFNEEGKDKILKIGANDCLEKPFKYSDLLKKIETCLESKHNTSRLATRRKNEKRN